LYLHADFPEHAFFGLYKVNAYAQDQKALDMFHKEVDEFFEKLKKEMGYNKENVLQNVKFEKKEPEQKIRTWGEYIRSFFIKAK
jgi:hypothetical protein